MICAVSFIQLMLCINSEIARQKPRAITQAFRINIQKSLYFFICVATAIRGFYFSSPSNGQLAWTESLVSAYYPILMSGSSLLVCFWAEVGQNLFFFQMFHSIISANLFENFISIGFSSRYKLGKISVFEQILFRICFLQFYYVFVLLS